MSVTNERPRRSARATGKSAGAVASPATPTPSSSKRKTRDLDHLLTHSLSKLTNVDISDVINYENFLKLSEESQQQLCSLLPPTAFTTFQPSLDGYHPAALSKTSPDADKSASSTSEQRSPTTLDPTLFSNAFFLSGAMTFQDHLFTGWLSRKAKEDVDQYEQGVTAGSMHAEWKDEQWTREHPLRQRGKLRSVFYTLHFNVYKVIVLYSSTVLDLVNLVKRSLLQEGDIITYRRTFSSIGITVEKELLVYKINPLSHALDLLLQPGETPLLPKELTVADPSPPKPPTLTMEGIMSSAELEEGVLEVTKQIPPEVLSSANRLSYTTAAGGAQDTVVAGRAAKAATIWRWRDEVKVDLGLQFSLDRGGRDTLGTVYYLSRLS
ncbi:Asx homology domain-containing protein [Irpex lacteus]|nr:Asx homology domain-containing protein [Irpex lacteus]